jgi:Protein of unknown function (DUF2996)
MTEETTAKPAAAKPAAKKEKPPALEEKPFAEFIETHYLPAVKDTLASQGITDLTLTFAKEKMAIAGFSGENLWQIIGSWQEGNRNFNLYFASEDIQDKKYFSCHEGNKPSTIEHFLGDERKITLDLMVFGLFQRLNGQKWLARN